MIVTLQCVLLVALASSSVKATIFAFLSQAREVKQGARNDNNPVEISKL